MKNVEKVPTMIDFTQRSISERPEERGQTGV